MTAQVLLDGASLTRTAVAAIADAGATVVLTQDAKARVHAARAVVDRTAAGDAPVYGIMKSSSTIVVVTRASTFSFMSW